LIEIKYNVFLTLKYLVYNFQTTYIGISMLNLYATKFHLPGNFLKLLKRAGLSTYHIQYFYVTVIRPISEYACTVWNHNLTSIYTKWLAGILSKRALRIIYGDQIKRMPYFNALYLANLESLKDHRNEINKSFFKKILSRDSCLHFFLPPELIVDLLNKSTNRPLTLICMEYM